MASDPCRLVRLKPDEVGVTPEEVTALRRLIKDGAWADREVDARLGSPVSFHQRGLITRLTTVIGDLTVLTPRGARACGIPANRLPSPMVQTSRAYVRLSLATLGWTEGGRASTLLEYDTSGRMTAAMTDTGPALVIGKLPNGYSLSALRGVSARLKSTTLCEDFWVVSLTPGQRGRQFAERNRSWFRQVSVVPDLSSADCPQADLDDGRSGPSRESRLFHSADDEALLQYELSCSGYEYGPLWADIMRLPREGRLDAFHQALACDGVIAEQQLDRHYGLTRHDLGRVPFVDALIRPLHSRPAFQVKTRFYLSQTRYRHLQWSTLDHAASVGEMRVMRNVPPNPAIWHSGGVLGRPTANRPDAVYLGNWGPEAIEYDRGTYTQRVIENKLSAWSDQGFDDVRWGVPSAQRQAALAQTYSMTVLHVRWF